MSCCKVQVKKEDKIKSSYSSNFIKNILTIFSSIAILTIGFPILYFICLYFVISGTITETDNSVGKMARVLINAFKRLMDEDSDVEYEDDLDEVFQDLIENPENYEIVGLEKDQKTNTENNEEFKDKN